MKIAFRIILSLLVVTAGLWLWRVFFPTPEKVILHQLDKVARDASFNGKENPLIIANRAETLAGFFSTNIEVNLDVPGRIERTFVGRAEITQAAAGAHTAVSSLAIKFLDPEISLSADKQFATVSLVVEAKSSHDTEPVMQPMKFTFQKIGHDWLITHVESERALS